MSDRRPTNQEHTVDRAESFLAVPDEKPLSISECTLDDLARIVTEQNRLTIKSLGMAIHHALEVGAALLEARSRVPEGQWGEWCQDNLPISQDQVGLYIRLAHYRDKVLEHHPSTLQEARALLRGLPPTFGFSGATPKPAEVVDAVYLLRDEGLTQRQIASELGLSKSAVDRYLKPEKRRKHEASMKNRRHRDRQAREALKRQERDRAMKNAGGTPSHAYAHLRKCASALQRAIEEAIDHEVESNLRQALDDIYRAEDRIVRALGISV